MTDAPEDDNDALRMSPSIATFRDGCRYFLNTSLDSAAKDCVDDNISRQFPKEKYAALKQDQRSLLQKTQKIMWDLPLNVLQNQLTLLSAETRNDPIFTDIVTHMAKQAHHSPEHKAKLDISTHNSRLAEINLKHSMDFVLKMLEAMNNRQAGIEGEEFPVPLRVSKQDFEDVDIAKYYRNFKRLYDALERQGTALQELEGRSRAVARQNMDKNLVKDVKIIQKGLTTLASVSDTLGSDRENNTLATLRALVHVLHREYKENINIPGPLDLEFPGRNLG